VPRVNLFRARIAVGRSRRRAHRPVLRVFSSLAIAVPVVAVAMVSAGAACLSIGPPSGMTLSSVRLVGRLPARRSLTTGDSVGSPWMMGRLPERSRRWRGPNLVRPYPPSRVQRPAPGISRTDTVKPTGSQFTDHRGAFTASGAVERAISRSGLLTDPESVLLENRHRSASPAML
jgi:hypothetical protein